MVVLCTEAGACCGCCCAHTGRPAGRLYESAHMLYRTLQRQQLERGWCCAGSQPGGPAAAAAAAADGGVGGERGGSSLSAWEGAADQNSSSSSPAPPRRFLTSAERKRQQLAAQGARSYQEWAALKQKQQERQKQHIKVQQGRQHTFCLDDGVCHTAIALLTVWSCMKGLL